MLGWIIELKFNLADGNTVYSLGLKPDGIDSKGYFYGNISEIPLFDQFLKYFE